MIGFNDIEELEDDGKFEPSNKGAEITVKKPMTFADTDEIAPPTRGYMPGQINMAADAVE